MRSPSAPFVTSANAREGGGIIWLLRINISDTPEATGDDDLFLACWDENVTYFRRDSGVDTAQVYTAFPISIGTIGENNDGQVDTLNVTLGNASRTVEAYLQNADPVGLRGRKVTIRCVWEADLADADAFIEDNFYIDSVSSTVEAAQFSLVSRLSLLNIELPRRIYSRNFCQWRYKGPGCWLDVGGTLTPATGFDTTHTTLYSLPARTLGTKIHQVGVGGVDITTDHLRIDMKCAVPANIALDSQIEITSSGTYDSEEIHFADLRVGGPLLTYSGLNITTGWQTFTIPFANNWSNTGGLVDWSAVDYVRIYTATGTAIDWSNISVYRATPWGFDPSAVDSCNKTLADCRRHNNARQFGAFPTVPYRKTVNV